MATKRQTVDKVMAALRARGVIVTHIARNPTLHDLGEYAVKVGDRTALRSADELADVLAGKDSWLGAV